MDNSLTRRGMPCWYKVEQVGVGAINDALLVQSSMFSILKKYFHDKPYYTNVLEMFNEVLNLKNIDENSYPLTNN